jgi:cytochrome c2
MSIPVLGKRCNDAKPINHVRQDMLKADVKYPRVFVSGTKMIFAGLTSRQQVNVLWADVKQFDANGNLKSALTS